MIVISSEIHFVILQRVNLCCEFTICQMVHSEKMEGGKKECLTPRKLINIETVNKKNLKKSMKPIKERQFASKTTSLI